MPPARRTPKAPARTGSDAPFVYITDAGDQITVPSIAVAPRPSPIKLLRAQAANNQAAAALLVFESACGDALEQIEALSDDEQNRFLAAWGEHSGTSLGESKPS